MSTPETPGDDFDAVAEADAKLEAAHKCFRIAIVIEITPELEPNDPDTFIAYDSALAWVNAAKRRAEPKQSDD